MSWIQISCFCFTVWWNINPPSVCYETDEDNKMNPTLLSLPLSNHSLRVVQHPPKKKTKKKRTKKRVKISCLSKRCSQQTLLADCLSNLGPIPLTNWNVILVFWIPHELQSGLKIVDTDPKGCTRLGYYAHDFTSLKLELT